MANKFTNFLSSVFNGSGDLRDYQHAARLYQDDFYNLAPKAGWLYYIVFDINSEVLISPHVDSTWRGKNYNQTVGILAKSADLPRYTIKTEMVNQYNRKTYVQTGITYNPVRISFHDDMANVTTNLWKSYYNYYYADGNYNKSSTTNMPQAFTDNKFNTMESGVYKYGLNNNQTKPFFNNVTIYLLNKKKYSSVTMINPIVSAWDHGKLDQTSSDFMESTMSLNYESVFYDTSNKSSKKLGFSDFHYDRTPSPLNIGGVGTNSILGENGIISGAEEVFGDVNKIFDGNASPIDILNTAFKVKNLARNVSNITKAGLIQEGYSVLSGQTTNLLTNIKQTGSIGQGVAATVAQPLNAVGIDFFKNNNTSVNNVVKAVPKTLDPI